MQTILKKITSLLIIFVLLMPLVLGLHVDAATTGSGTSSDPWDISADQNGRVTAILSGDTLTISVNGSSTRNDMEDYTRGESPWYSKRTMIKKIEIDTAVTRIGNYAFSDCTALTNVNREYTTLGRIL